MGCGASNNEYQTVQIPEYRNESDSRKNKEEIDFPAKPNFIHTKCSKKCEIKKDEKENDRKEVEECEICSICLEDINPEKKTYSCPNGHMFHIQCIGPWCEEFDTESTKGPNCPYCKCSLPQNIKNWVSVENSRKKKYFIDLETGNRGWKIPKYVI